MKGIPQTTKIRQAQCLVQGLQTADSHRKSGQSGTSLPWCNKHPVPTIINDRKVRAQRHLQKSASPTQGLQNVVLALECGLSEGVSGSQSPSPSRMPQHTRRKAFHRQRATRSSNVSRKVYEPQTMHRKSGLSGTSLLWCDKDIAVGQSAHTKTLFQKHARPTQGLQTVVPALEACVFKSFSGSQSPPSAATPRHTSDGRNSTDNEIPAHRESRAKPTRRRFGTGSPTCQEPCCCRATSITHVIRNCAHKEKHRNRQHAQRKYARLEYRHWNVAFPKISPARTEPSSSTAMDKKGSKTTRRPKARTFYARTTNRSLCTESSSSRRNRRQSIPFNPAPPANPENGNEERHECVLRSSEQPPKWKAA